VNVRRLLIGLAGAGAFLALAIPHLDAQGAQYDELHQAVSAFAWCGRPTGLFSPVEAFGLPVLNMTYSGAIKTALFGLWLRTHHCAFTITAWRLTGLLFAASGFVLFAVLSRASAMTIALVIGLLVTDSTVLIGTRHDYGPIALALAIRLAFLGVWLRVRYSDRAGLASAFALGAIIGVAAFEKVNSLVLVPVLILIVASDERLRRRSPLLACAAGLLVGLAPLIAVNVYSWTTTGRLISAAQAAVQSRALMRLPAFVGSYLSIGAGAELRAWILGTTIPGWLRIMEGALTGTLLILSAVRTTDAAGDRTRLLDRSRAARIAVAAYLLCMVGTWLLPAETEAHHWIVGTPFQYVAFALAAQGADEWKRWTRLALILLFAVRLPALIATESSIIAGRYGIEWHPDFSRLGIWASGKPSETLFVAADWGLATQIACFSNGSHVPKELFWNYERREQLEGALSGPGTRTYYLVALADPSPVNREGTRRLMADAASVAGWREEPVDPDAAALKTLVIRRFIRTPASPH
jgi:hypothetical protein